MFYFFIIRQIICNMVENMHSFGDMLQELNEEKVRIKSKRIISRFNRFLKTQNYTLKLDELGYCNGFSAWFGICAQQGRLEEWCETLIFIKDAKRRDFKKFPEFFIKNIFNVYNLQQGKKTANQVNQLDIENVEVADEMRLITLANLDSKTINFAKTTDSVHIRCINNISEPEDICLIVSREPESECYNLKLTSKQIELSHISKDTLVNIIKNLVEKHLVASVEDRLMIYTLNNPMELEEKAYVLLGEDNFDIKKILDDCIEQDRTILLGSDLHTVAIYKNQDSDLFWYDWNLNLPQAASSDEIALNLATYDSLLGHASLFVYKTSSQEKNHPYVLNKYCLEQFQTMIRHDDEAQTNDFADNVINHCLINNHDEYLTRYFSIFSQDNLQELEYWLPEFVKIGKRDFISLFIENGVNIDARNVADHSSLWLAYQFNHMDIVHYLIEKGADIAPDDYNNLYDVALEKQDELMLSILLQHIKINSADDMSLTEWLNNVVLWAKTNNKKCIEETGQDVLSSMKKLGHQPVATSTLPFFSCKRPLESNDDVERPAKSSKR